MNKGELIAAVAAEVGLTKADVEKVINATLDTIKTNTPKGGVQLIGFGTFDVGARAERTGRNPLTGKEITIAAATTVKFKAGSAFKEAVNK